MLNTQLHPTRSDELVWGLSKSRKYDSNSGYKLLESLLDLVSPQPPQPPLEKKLWSNLWKVKAPPKLKHFLWRVNSGALAVKAQLRTRGIHLDPTCSVCGQGSETICHVLFQCKAAKEVWDQSNFPLPLAGWSQNSIFLNLHYLLSVSKNKSVSSCVRQSFPWILWHVWKARNLFCYERITTELFVVIRRAMEDAVVWLNLQDALPRSEGTGVSTGVRSTV